MRRAAALLAFLALAMPAQGAVYRQDQAALLHRLSLAPRDARQPHRLALARFYVAHGRAAEANGVLTVMAADDPRLPTDPAFRLLRGEVRMRLGDARGAVADLSGLQEPHACLWRLRAHERLGQGAAARAVFACGEPALVRLDARGKEPFLLAAIRADLGAVGGGPLATRLLAQLPSDHAEANLWRGTLAVRAGRPQAAGAAFVAAAKAGSPPVAVRATMALTDLELHQGRIGPTAAIRRLEALAFRWRGGGTEHLLLRRLARLHEVRGNLRSAFAAYDVLLAHFGRWPDAPALAVHRAALFTRLFGDGGTALPPARAFALYWDYRHLAPKGPAGDAMIRRLADRLIALDLLPQAANLLEHQVVHRLDGVPQAAVAARLADVLVMNGEPERALRILRETEQPWLPADIAASRKSAAVRALAALGRIREAEALLGADRSPIAEAIRRQLYWRAKDWPQLIAVLKPLVGRPAADPIDVLRYVVALAATGAEVELRHLRLRHGPAMAKSPLAGAFEMLTGEPGSMAPQDMRRALDQAVKVAA